MVTYNHEPYICKAIESVVNQKTDFEFELVIGEDCSEDRTREICFEYQKKYPRQIRVLWAHENVYRKGGNAARVSCRCRGKYIALLEGDDYWSDPFKLQKQIDLIRRHSAIGCVANYRVENEATGKTSLKEYRGDGFIQHGDLAHFYPHTSTYVFARSFLEERDKRFSGIRCWYDVPFMHCLVEMGRVVHLQEVVSVYRLTGKGIATGLSGQQKKLLGVKQYLDLYLHGPRSFHRRFGALVLTYIAFFFNHSIPGWSDEFTGKNKTLLTYVFWRIFLRQFYDLRSIRAFLRYLRFRLGFVK